MEKIYEMFAEAIINGTYFFRDLCKRLRKGVAAALEKRGRKDLATDNNARPKEED
jgi:hypothetical protein